jgi:hypothetical protein
MRRHMKENVPPSQYDIVLKLTYHSRLIPEWVAVTSQTFLRPRFAKMTVRNTADVTGGKTTAV